MTFRANNIAAQNPITLFLQTIEGDMVNVGWVNVSSQIAANYTPNCANSGASNSNVKLLVDVFKSPSGNNSIANDWYVILGTDLATNTYLFVSMCQAFNASSNLVTNYPYIGGQAAASANVYANQFNSNANTTNLYFTAVNANLINSANGSNARVFTLNTGSFSNTSNSNGINYHYSVTIDRLIISVANASSMNQNGSSFYIGMYDSFMPLTIDPFPIVCANIPTTQTDTGYPFQAMAMTEPVFTANNNSTIGGFAGNFMLTFSQGWISMISQGSSGRDQYLGSGGACPLTRMAVGGQGTSGGGGTTGLRGLLKDCMASTLQAGRGDQIFWNYNGTQYKATCIGIGSASWTGTPATLYGPFLLQV